MTAKEAIEVIKVAIAEVEWEYPLDYAAAFDEGIGEACAKDACEVGAGNTLLRGVEVSALRL